MSVAIGFGLLTLIGAVLRKDDRKVDPTKPDEPFDDEARARRRILEVARGELGEQNPDKYWAETAPALGGSGAAWCGGFALWVLHEAGVGTEVPWVVGKGFCFRLPQTSTPQPGDIAYFDRAQHHAIVVRVDGDTLHTIDGNQPPGESVTERTRPVSDVRAFFDVGPLIRGEGLIA
jgi:hypothetical protein